MYKIKIVLEVSLEKLVKAFDASQADVTKWNKTLAKHEIVKTFENGAKIFYQVTPANGPGDMVSARDWFMISKAGMRGNVWFQGGCSVEYPEGPKGDTPRPRAALFMCLRKYSAIGNSAIGSYVVLYSKLILKAVLLEVSYGKND